MPVSALRSTPLASITWSSQKVQSFFSWQNGSEVFVLIEVFQSGLALIFGFGIEVEQSPSPSIGGQEEAFDCSFSWQNGSEVFVLIEVVQSDAHSLGWLDLRWRANDALGGNWGYPRGQG